MEPLPPSIDFIGGFLRRPEMYASGDKFDGVVNLMIGMKISRPSGSVFDAEVATWDEFQQWLIAKYADRLKGPLFPEFRSWYKSGTEALQALTAEYDEFKKATILEDIRTIDSFSSVLLRPQVFATNWSDFCSFVWGMLYMVDTQPRNINMRAGWIDFLKWLNTERLALPDNWPESYTRPAKTLQVFRQQYADDQEAFIAFSQCYREFLQSYFRQASYPTTSSKP